MKKVLFVIVNVLLVMVLIYLVVSTDSDKSPIIFMFYYPILIFLNLLLKRYNKDMAGFINKIAIVMIIAFFPLIYLMVEYLVV